MQVELTGNSIFEYIPECDHKEMGNVLSLPHPSTGATFPPPNSRGDIELERAFCIRMKCVLAKRNAGLVTSGWKVTLRMKLLTNLSNEKRCKKKVQL